LPIPQGSIGTLHALCYRALGRPPIAESKVKQWNQRHPALRLSPSDADLDQTTSDPRVSEPGDTRYQQYQRCRGRMIPREQWPESVKRFARHWEGWKKDQGYLDFTDLIEAGVKDVPFAPGNPSVLVADEGQDLCPLQWALLRRWGQHADRFLVAADDDQTIYSFAGADPEVLLGREAGVGRQVLAQSYRIPAAVHRLSQDWIGQVRRRKPKEFRPREAEGDVRVLRRGHYKAPEAILGDAEGYLRQGKTVMFLATCAYMLDPLKAVLRKQAIPFHNPYRRSRRDWNPLAEDGARPSVPDTVLRFVKPHATLNGSQEVPWTVADVKLWLSLLRASYLKEGAKERLKAVDDQCKVDIALLVALVEPEQLGRLLDVVEHGTLEEMIRWLADGARRSRLQRLRYAADVILKRGDKAATSPPKVIIGTGHSVKGGEADVVYLFPDLSRSGARQWAGPRRERDALVRLGYVMMTRARESVVLCPPAGKGYLPFQAVGRRAARTPRSGSGPA